MRVLVAVAPALLFVVMAWPAIDENSATYDETYHVPAGYTYLTRGDYRLGSEHPPVVKQLFAVPLLPLALHVGADAERAFASALGSIEAQWVFGDRFLYRDNRPQPVLHRARLVVLALGAALVALVSVWACDAFGVIGGTVAATISALDPNLLAHGTLATTDLGFSLFAFAALFGARCSFRSLKLWIACLTGLVFGAAFGTKHSALVLPSIVLVLGVLRVLDRSPWPLGRGRIVASTMRARTAMLLGILCLWAVMTWASLWAVYGFRYAVGPDGGASLPIAHWTHQIRVESVLAEMLARGGDVPDETALARATEARPPGLIEQAIETAARDRLLPEAYLFGLAVATALAQIRSNYFLGQISYGGWRWYFPFAFLVKTPLGTLGLSGAALVLLLIVLGRRAAGAPPSGRAREAMILLVAPTFVLLSAMQSNVNIGYRHILAVVPFVCALAGYVPAELEGRFGKGVAVVTGTVVCLLVAAETLAARPHFLPFFNVAAGGARGGLRLLSDSNLDWGQGLPALRRWMTERGVPRVNLCYFGTADPAAYGIDFVPLAGSHFGRVEDLGTIGYEPRPPVLPGWVAISATHLQGTYLPPELRSRYAFLRHKQPAAVPAEAIYVYWVERWGE